MDTNEMLAQAQQMDLNRQRQIEAQKASINRLLEARELDNEEAWAFLTAGHTREAQLKLEAEAKLQAIGEIVAHWDDDARDRIVEVLGRG